MLYINTISSHQFFPYAQLLAIKLKYFRENASPSNLMANDLIIIPIPFQKKKNKEKNKKEIMLPPHIL